MAVQDQSRTQKAVYLSAPNGGDLVIKEKLIPTPGPGELLIKLHASAFNPIDQYIWQFNVDFVEKYPVVLGFDGAGEVVEIGDNVVGFVKGDRVLFEGDLSEDDNKATFQQYAIVPADIVGKLPQDMTYDDASTIPLCLVTAAVGLYANRDDPTAPRFSFPWEDVEAKSCSGKPILILGASSSVGQFAIQLARLSGFTTIIATASPRSFGLLKSIGATHVLDRTSESLKVDIEKILSDSKLEIVYVAAGGKEPQELGWELLSGGGVLSCAPRVELETRSKFPDKSIQFFYCSVYLPHLRKLGASLFTNLYELMEKKLILPNHVHLVAGGLKAVKDGLELMKDRKVVGAKVVIHPQETVSSK